MTRLACLLAPLLLLSACEADSGTGGAGGSSTDTTGASPSTTGTTSPTTSSTGSTASTSGAGGGGGECLHEAGNPDFDRFVIVGHPYDDAVDPDGSYEVLRLSTAGALTTTGTRFHMGPPADKQIQFSPDGEIGFAIQDDGTVGVFRLAPDGSVTVLNEGLAGDYYAEAVRWDDSVFGVYVMDPNFPENGGGVYTIGLGCDDSLSPGPRLFESKSARDLFFDPVSGDALLAARGALGSTAVSHLFRLTLAPPTVTASADAFGDDDAINSWSALTRNGRHVILADNSAFSSSPNRVASVEVTAAGLGAVQTITGIEDPYSIAVSPFDDAIVVTSGFGDGIFIVDYDPAAAQPLSLRGELDYVGPSPQLPGALATVDRGTLDGRVLIADVRGVYMVQFAAGATVTDLGVVDLGGGTEDVVAGIGVQP
ncbi:MAG: hypothetical protein HOV80_29345 [Polyangiaceae bacterium]|nr:hypothetical protein [Polyangiaceae bacterium]